MLVAEIHILLNSPLIHVHPVLMKRINQFRVERWPKDLEISVPSCATQKHELGSVDLSNAGHDLAIKRFKFRVQVGVIKIVGYGFIQQIEPDHGGLISITRGDFAPNSDGQILALRAFKQKRIAPAVIDVLTGLSTWGGVHIENYIEMFGLA